MNMSLGSALGQQLCKTALLLGGLSDQRMELLSREVHHTADLQIRSPGRRPRVMTNEVLFSKKNLTM